MNINELLKDVKCSCGQVHSCGIKNVLIEAGASKKAGELSCGYNRILLVADTNTYAVCGKRVVSQLGERLENTLIFEGDGFLIPNEEAIEKLSAHVTDSTDLIMGIGSGVIQDLCKYVSFKKELPYHIIATAPSMDGYASKGAAMIIGNMKVTYTAHVPEVIIGDAEILKDAPMDMIKSGYGDILGKFSCLNDWRLSHAVNSEYLCEYVYDLTYEMLSKTKDLGKLLTERDEAAIKILTEALIGVGIAMAYVGNSRPASGSEHHLSHFFEVIGIMKNEPYFMHGTDVAFSCVYTQRLREELLNSELPESVKPFDKADWESKIKNVYYDAADGVIALQNKLGWYNDDNLDVYKEKWEEIKEILADTPTSEELIGYLKNADMDIAEFEKMYGTEKINNAILYAKDLKDRYTVLWMYYTLCRR